MSSPSGKAVPKAAAKSAAKDDGVSASQITKMLGVLTYNAEKGKNQEKASAATEALTVYRALTDTAGRHAFVQEFETNGGGKTSQGLKFALTFTKRLLYNKTTTMAVTENMLTRCTYQFQCTIQHAKGCCSI